MGAIEQNRVDIASSRVRDYFRDNPRATAHEGLRWLNNQRVAGERLLLRTNIVNAIYADVRRGPPASKPLPTEVAPRFVVTPLRAPLGDLASNKPTNPPPVIVPPAPPTPAPATAPAPVRDTPSTREERIRFAEDVMLEWPTLTRVELHARVMKRFGQSLDTRTLQHVLEAGRGAAGLPERLRTPRPRTPPAPDVKPPPPVVVPAPAAFLVPTEPSAMLREAAVVLRKLAQSMQWKQVVITVTHEGGVTYASEPMPVLPMRGELTL